MSKYDHRFTLIEASSSTVVYQSGDNLARLDFFPSMVRVALYQKGSRLFPTFSVCPEGSSMPKTGRDRLSLEGLTLASVVSSFGDSIDEFTFGEHSIAVDKNGFRISHFAHGKPLFHDREILSYNFGGELGEGSHHYLCRQENERIYGLGDKTGPVNKNGRHFRFETFDAMGFDANSSDPLYKQVPFFVCENSLGAYGVYYDTYSNGDIDFGREKNNYYEAYKHASFEENALVYYVFYGTVDSIVSSFHRLIGRTALPPKWSFRYCGSTMSYTDSDEPEPKLREFLRLCADYGIEPGGFYLSSGYTQIGEKRYVFHWNKEKFKDPKALADEFRSHGVEFLPNIKPCFLDDHPLYPYISSKGWFLHYEDGTPAKFPFWGGMGSYLDFTNPEAFAFWTDCVKRSLVDLGYKSLWNDNNEYDVHDPDVYAHGFGTPIQAKLIRPLFSLLMMMASDEAVDHSRRIMSVTRSGVAGLERIGQTWTGDNRTSFEDFRGNHKMAMTLALSGFTFYGQDIGGFAGPKPSRELFLRWLQYGVFTPRMTLHSWNPDGSSTMPWLYPEDEEAVSAIFGLRKRLLPYIYSQSYQAVRSYRSLLRPVFLSDPGYDVESDCFFLGDSILVSPIFDEGKTEATALLPNGIWYRNGKAVSGMVEETVLPNDLPCFYVKEGSVLPIDENGLAFEIYAKEEGKFECRFFDDDGDELLKGEDQSKPIRVECLEGEVVVHLGCLKGTPCRLIDAKNRPLRIEE